MEAGREEGGREEREGGRDEKERWYLFTPTAVG